MSRAVDSPDYFCWLLDRALCWHGGYAAVLETYFDASARPEGTFCVAGFAFGADRAKKAVREWKSLWGDTRCHMTDLHARRGAFKDWSPDQTGAALTKAISVINAGASFGVAISCNANDVARFAPERTDELDSTILGGFRTPYALCCSLAMAALWKLAQGSQIAYFFEAGDRFQHESQSFIAWVTTHRRLHAGYGLRSLSVLGKDDCRLFEMSDILAWEWAKQVDRHHLEGKTHFRGSLTALLGTDKGKRYFRHFDEEGTRELFQGASAIEMFSETPSWLAGARSSRKPS